MSAYGFFLLLLLVLTTVVIGVILYLRQRGSGGSANSPSLNDEALQKIAEIEKRLQRYEEAQNEIAARLEKLVNAITSRSRESSAPINNTGRTGELLATEELRVNNDSPYFDEGGVLVNYSSKAKKYAFKEQNLLGIVESFFEEEAQGRYIIIAAGRTGYCYPLNKDIRPGVYHVERISGEQSWRIKEVAQCRFSNDKWTLQRIGVIVAPSLY
ncbi:MAG: hypothetical protein K9K75_06600 [Deltaproteobacteria bacterium]|nr:hypothetical protein [Deltaproteobacteria bacterium]